MPEYNSSALDGYEKRGAKGQPNGYAALGPDGKIPIAQIVANVTTGDYTRIRTGTGYIATVQSGRSLARHAIFRHRFSDN